MAAKDIRPYVLSENKSEPWVGLRRSLYGIPYGVHTQSGKPFSDDIGSLINESLRRKGANATQVLVRPKGELATAVNAEVAQNGARPTLLFEFEEWKTDTYFSASFYGRVNLSVLDPQMNALSKETFTANMTLSDAYPLAAVVANMIQELISKPSTQEALNKSKLPVSSTTSKVKVAAAPATTTQKECTVSQILDLQKAGLSDQQIKAACGK